MKCQNDLADCTCPDIAERLRKISDHGGIVSRWCTVCDRHYSQCKCEHPVWGVRHGGKTA